MVVPGDKNFVYSKLQYGILTWGSAKKNELGALSTRLNKIIKTNFRKKILSPITYIQSV